MGNMIAKIDTTIKIPPYFKNLIGKDGLIIEMKAGQPKEVPDNILNYYTKNRPHVFRKDTDPEPMQPKVGVLPEGGVMPGEFDPVLFVTQNYDNIEAGLETLPEPTRQKLLKVAKLLKLNDFYKQTSSRIKERIIHDINQKKSQEELVNKK